MLGSRRARAVFHRPLGSVASPGVTRAAGSQSRLTVSGENAGRQTAMYSAPSLGVE